MIRDPSDGSVKELWSPTTKEIHKLSHDVELTGNSGQLASGLPIADEKLDERLRLERAREWLQDWKAKQENGE